MNPSTSTEDEIAHAAADLSMYMDGELPSEQHDRLLQSLKPDSALREDWLVYHCIGDVLRSADVVPLRGGAASGADGTGRTGGTAGFGSRFRQQLEDEPFLFAPTAAQALAARPVAAAQRWRLPLAVAASVAAVVTAGVMVLPQRDAAQTARAAAALPAQTAASVNADNALTPLTAVAPVTPVVVAQPMAAAPLAVLAGSGATSAAPPDPALRAVSSEYLMAHRHYSTGLAMRGVVSHVRTAGYDGQ